MIMVAAALLAAPVAACDGETTLQVEACLEAEFKAADVELNRYWAAAVRRLTTDGQTEALVQLRRSEKAWIAYRDAECGLVYEYWKQGTIRGTFSLECQTRLTKARTMAIWSNWLTYVDSTPPLLPKPEYGN